MNIELTINNTTRTFLPSNDISLTWAIQSIFPSVDIAPSPLNQEIPLWVLLNYTAIINANHTSIHTISGSSIINIEYALHTHYFQTLHQYLLQFGISLTPHNIALLVFSLHVYVHNYPKIHRRTQILNLIQHYPQEITQPIQLEHTYIHAMHNLSVLQDLYHTFLHTMEHN